MFLLQTATVLSQKVVLIVDVGMGFNDLEDVPNSSIYSNLPYTIADFTVAAADFNPSYAGFLTGNLQLGTNANNYLPYENLHSIANKAGIPTGHFGYWSFNRTPDANKYTITVDPQLAIAAVTDFVKDKSDYMVTLFMPPLSDFYISAGSPMRKGLFGGAQVICYNNKPNSYENCSRFPYVSMMRAKDSLLGPLLTNLKNQGGFIAWAPVHGGIDPHTDSLSAPKTALRGGQFSLFDGGIRVPFRYFSGTYPKLRNDANAIDLAPTFMSMFNLKISNQQGINLFDPNAVRTTQLRWYTDRSAEGNCDNSSPAFAEQQIIDGKKRKILYDADPNNDQIYDWNMGYEAKQSDVSFNKSYPRLLKTIPGCKDLVATGIKRNLSALPKKSQPRPNILVVLLDDVGMGDIGYYSNHKSGNNYPSTPNIDRLFGVKKDKNDIDQSGIEFTNGNSAASICTPTRYSMVTGRHPSNKFNPIRAVYAHTINGKVDNVRPPYPGAVGSGYNIFKFFKGLGYKTCHFGKWHISDPRSYKTPAFFGVDPDCYKIHSGYAPPAQTYPMTAPDYQAHSSEIITADALNALEKINGTQPYFMNIWHSKMHQPFMTMPGQLATVGFDNSKNPYLINRSTIFTAETPLQIYNGLFKILDNSIGDVFDFVNKNPGEDGTIIIFHSDNGAEDRGLADTSVGDRGPFRGQKRSLYEGGHRAPTNIRWITPKGNVFSGSVGVPLASYDFFPTLAGLTGHSITEIPGYGSLDGVDLSQCILYDQCDYSRPLRWEATWPNNGDCSEASGRFAIKWGNYTCIARSTTKGAIRLAKVNNIRCYDSSRGPLQFIDIAAKSPAIVQKFKELLVSWPNYDTKYFPPKIPSNLGDTNSQHMRVNFRCN